MSKLNTLQVGRPTAKRVRLCNAAKLGFDWPALSRLTRRNRGNYRPGVVTSFPAERAIEASGEQRVNDQPVEVR